MRAGRWDLMVPSRAIVLAVAVAMSALVVLAHPVAAHESYTVRPGDTLSHVAVRTGVTVSALAAENGIRDPNRIRVGQVLRVPHSSGSSAGSGTSTPKNAVASTQSYTVKNGDTLGHIALRLGVSRRALATVNGLSNPNRIFIGQVLQVPAGGVATSGGVGGSYPNLLDRIASDPVKLSLVPLFEKWAAANGIPVDLLMAVAWHESGWNNSALSFKGAQGIGQIMPATGAWIASDLIGVPSLDATVPEDNIRMSARYLRWLENYLGTEELALAGYYQGPGAVRAGIMYESTEMYVASVLAHRKFFTSS